jgi:predicted HTH transcriptional regulator
LNIKTIKDLIKNGESVDLEFKLKSNHPQRILNELVAFANTKGGKLIIGIDDNLNIVGLNDGDEDIYLLEKLIHDQIYPELPYKMEKLPISKIRELVIIDVESGDKKPYYVNKTGENVGEAFIRFKDESIKAGKILRMMLNHKFENVSDEISYEKEMQPVFSLFKDLETVSYQEIKSSLKIKNRDIDLLLLKLIKAGLLGFKLDSQNEFYTKDPDENYKFDINAFLKA